MKQLQGLKNFSLNIRELMLKCKNGEKITREEQQTIVEFYLETIDYLSKATS